MARTTILWGALLPGLLSASIGQAQVAAPSLVPLYPIVIGSPGPATANLVTANPAALQWGSPARVGAGEARLRRTDQGAATDFIAQYGGLRWVEESFALAGEALRSDDQDSASTERTQASAAALAFRAAEWAALGAGQTRQSDTSADATTATTDRATTSTWGVALRFNETAYLGYAAGIDARKFTDRNVAANSFEESRAFQYVGAGFRGGGSFAYHVEYFRALREEYKVGNTSRDKVDAQTAVAEFNWSGLLLGYRNQRASVQLASGTSDIAVSDYALGWAPEHGLSILAHVLSGSSKDTGGATVDLAGKAVSVAYQF